MRNEVISGFSGQVFDLCRVVKTKRSATSVVGTVEEFDVGVLGRSAGLDMRPRRGGPIPLHCV